VGWLLLMLLVVIMVVLPLLRLLQRLMVVPSASVRGVHQQAAAQHLPTPGQAWLLSSRSSVRSCMLLLLLAQLQCRRVAAACCPSSVRVRRLLAAAA
jgi:hypothetical protein